MTGFVGFELFNLRDRPFNLQGVGEGGMVFRFVQIFFSDNTRVRTFILFLSRKVRKFFPEFNIRLYDKNSESDYYFFPPPKSEYFVQQHWELEVKWSVPNVLYSVIFLICRF